MDTRPEFATGCDHLRQVWAASAKPDGIECSGEHPELGRVHLRIEHPRTWPEYCTVAPRARVTVGSSAAETVVDAVKLVHMGELLEYKAKKTGATKLEGTIKWFSSQVTAKASLEIPREGGRPARMGSAFGPSEGELTCTVVPNAVGP